MATILIIEDESAIVLGLEDALEAAGFETLTARNGELGLKLALAEHMDLIILDIMLPDRSGWDICRDIRQAGMATPILFLTARSHTTDKVLGLRLGGDDYLTKPFKAVELVARIEALLRRVPIRSGHGVHQFGSIHVDVRRAEVTRDGKPVYLSAREFQLLRYLIERSGASIPREELLSAVWGYASSTLTRTIDMHVSSLREKLEENPKRPELIVTVAGVGYKFMGSRNS
jgi:DNA-binding response OmpR family regulator